MPRLTAASENPTLGVVKTDIRSTAPPPPDDVPAGPVARAALILQGVASRAVEDLQQDLTRVLRTVQPGRELSELAADGSPKIPSMVGVFLLSQVGAAVGRPQLVDLKTVRREDMRSLGGIARLAHRALHPVQTGSVAS